MSRNAVPTLLDKKRTGIAREIVDRNIATPPICDIGFSCMCRLPGIATMLCRLVSQITTGVINKASNAEPKYTNKYVFILKNFVLISYIIGPCADSVLVSVLTRLIFPFLPFPDLYNKSC